MTTEEKLQHFYDFSIESAHNEAKQMLDEYQVALENIYHEHKETTNRQAKAQLDDEVKKSKREFNKALSAEQLMIKRALSKKQNEIREKLFINVEKKLKAFKATEEYKAYLLKKIKEAVDFADGDEMIIYIDPTDAALINELANTSGVSLTLSHEDFFGGIRAVIASKNILIDYSFSSMLREEKENYHFNGGIANE